MLVVLGALLYTASVRRLTLAQDNSALWLKTILPFDVLLCSGENTFG